MILRVRLAAMSHSLTYAQVRWYMVMPVRSSARPPVRPRVRPSARPPIRPSARPTRKIIETHEINEKNQYSNSGYLPDSISKVDF